MNSHSHKPKKCCHPDCFNCPYSDCIWDELTSSDMSETNDRDYQFYEESTGEKYHKGTDNEYRAEREKSCTGKSIRSKEIVLNTINNII